MSTRLVSLITVLLVLTAAHPVNAAVFFENVQYSRTGGSNLRNRTASASYSNGPSQRCLYYNAQGICMIEQYIDTSNYNPDRLRSYYPTYDRDYLSRERRYGNRDDDDSDDDDIYDYRYYEDDDNNYTSIEDDDNSDDDDFQDNHNDDDADFDDFFDDDDSSDDDDDNDSTDDDDDSDDDEDTSDDDENDSDEADDDN